MLLSDESITEAILAGRIGIDPYNPANLQPASLDLTLDNKIRTFKNTSRPYIDIRTNLDDLTQLVTIPDNDQPYILQPGQFVLANTREAVRIPNDLVARLEGKSSLGRLGLAIHSTAGFVDPGFQGNLTLELSNLAQLPITLYPDMKIAQIAFIRLTTQALRPYGTPALGSRYQGQTDPTASRIHLDYN